MTQSSTLIGINSIPNVSAGAHAALRGYRRQFLYALYRIISASGKDVTFHLERFEDIEILDGNGALREVIQVKDYSRPLVYSNLVHQSDAKNFLRRVVKLAAVYPDARVILASYGTIGTELLRGWEDPDSQERRNLNSKLAEDGFTPAECLTIFASVSLQKLDEAQVTREVDVWLSESALGGDPGHAFKLLYSWMYEASEHGRHVTQAELIEVVNMVGQYLQERTFHHQNWYTTIKPLEADAGMMDDREQLAMGFYEGVGATYQHIVAGVDVPREQHLNSLYEAFEASRVVILRGASGQGKSAMAYRFFHDYLNPRCWAYEIVKLDAYSHAQAVVRAIAGHLKVVKAHIYIYLDVRPGTAYWTEVVRGLLANPNIFILITIREEDYRRIAESSADLGIPQTVSLSFDQNEAQQIYDQLTALAPSPDFLSFQEAWARFGGGSALLEFVHLVTKHESLRDRLERQVIHLQELVNSGQLPPGAVSLLRRVAFASANGARLIMREAVVGLNLPEPLQIITQFEHEYQLIRRTEEGRFLEGLHPIRSNIIAELLLDEDFNPWSAVAIQCLPAIPEADLEAFLLHSFLRGDQRQQLLAALREFNPQTWLGVAAVVHALLWLGIDEYIERNKDLIAEVASQFSGFWICLDTDFSGYLTAAGDPEWFELEVIPQGTRETVEGFRRRQTPKEEVFDRVKEWLTQLNSQPAQPRVNEDWLGLAEVVFWIGFLEITSPSFDFSSLHLETLGALSLQDLSAVAYGLSFLNDEMVQTWLEEQRPRWLGRFQRELLTPYIEDDHETIRAHFVINMLSEDLGESSPDYVLSQTIARLDVLQKLIPNRAVYASKGYGHELFVETIDSDSSIKHIPSKRFFPQWVVRVNSTFNGRAEYLNRSESWQSYTGSIMHLRREIVEVLRMLRRALSYYFRDEAPSPLWSRYIDSQRWNSIISILNHTEMLPQSAVDAFGFVNEGQDKNRRIKADFTTSRASLLAIDEFEPCRKALRDVTNGLANFLKQIAPWLATSGSLSRTASLESREDLVKQTMRALGDTLSYSAWLPTQNLTDALGALEQFQIEFRQRFSLYVSAAELSELEGWEKKQFLGAFGLWHSFLHQPTAIYRNPQKDLYRSIIRFRDSVPTALATGVENITSGLLSVNLASDIIMWKGKPALWFTCEVTDASLYPRVALAVAEQIKASLVEIKSRPFGEYLPQTFYPKVLLIPLVLGKSMSAETYVYDTYTLLNGRTDEKFSWLDSVLHSVPIETWRQFSIQLWESERLDVAKQLIKDVWRCLELIGHINGLEKLADFPDISFKILDDYRDKVKEKFHLSYRNAMSCAQNMQAYLERHPEDGRGTRAELSNAVRNLNRTLEGVGDSFEHSDPEQLQSVLVKAYTLWVNDVVVESNS